ncbi:MAG: hypothetical protein HFG80_07855 [Eubacterium sp.]|jgi:hypothetical protein|nr:hypothetical protein [Eubacterium sp.]
MWRLWEVWGQANGLCSSFDADPAAAVWRTGHDLVEHGPGEDFVSAFSPGLKAACR